VHTVTLADNFSIPIEAKPLQILNDRLLGSCDAALRVQILHTKDKLAPLGAHLPPSKQE
jgi:hypothetical protein